MYLPKPSIPAADSFNLFVYLSMNFRPMQLANITGQTRKRVRGDFNM